VSHGFWQLASPTVIAMTAGALSHQQLLWVGVLHGGPGACVGGLAALERHGLRNWQDPTSMIFVPAHRGRPGPLPGLTFIRSRRWLGRPVRRDGSPPLLSVAPAAVTWAEREPSVRRAQGLIAAVLQQRLATAADILEFAHAFGSFRHKREVVEMAGAFQEGMQSVAELDVRRMCRSAGLRQPDRQVKRTGSDGRVRYTDCEWRLPDGRILVLEVDGGFHMEAEHWEDDMVRERSLADPSRVPIRCTARELRDRPEQLAHDLRRLGVSAA
jgi:hypothetical protein